MAQRFGIQIHVGWLDRAAVSRLQKRKRNPTVGSMLDARPRTRGAAGCGGRRRKTSRGGNRGTGNVRACGVLYGDLSVGEEASARR